MKKRKLETFFALFLGNSKIAAKNNASEKALRDLVIQKMVQVPKATLNLNAPIPPEVEGEDTEMKEDDPNDTRDENPIEVPMLHLASFALHKLFTEWQSEGFEIPDFKAGGQIIAIEGVESEVSAASAPAPPVIKTTVPENANSMHPTTLLCMVSSPCQNSPIRNSPQTQLHIHHNLKTHLFFVNSEHKINN